MSQSVSQIPVRKQRTWRGLLVTLLFLVLLGIVGILWFVWYSSHDLNALMAEMDVQDPGWRQDDIEASRKVVPAAGNSALHIVAVAKLRAGQSVITAAMEKVFENLPPHVQLNEQQIDYLEKRFAILQAAVVEARKFKDMPRGRHPIKYSEDWISTLVPHLQDAREVCELLNWDAAWRAHGGDDEGALESCLALQNAAHSMGDEPFIMSLLVRVGCHVAAVQAIERTLAQGRFTPASEPTLNLMQDTFARELSEPTLLIALRGERAGLHQFVQAVAQGKVNRASLGLVPWTATVSILEGLPGGMSGKRSLSNEVDSRLIEHFPAYLTRQHAAMLRFANELVDAAKLPPEKADERFNALEKRIRDEPYLVRITAPSFIKTREEVRRMHAHLRCAVAALAAERYRLARKRWPDALDDLVKAGFLDAVPIDPYDSKPIRLKRMADGLIFYSVGPDKNRDNPTELLAGTDLGFRLWDISWRRQPPDPPEREENPAK
jgi:hypothetical protein